MKNERILIIESSATLGERIKKALQDDGYDAKLVTKGEEALQSILDALPHLILLDAVLDGADTYEILEKKQAEPMLAKIPVFLLSTEAEPINMRRMPAGSVAQFFLAMHIDPGDVVDKVNKHFNNTSAKAPTKKEVPNKKLLWVEDDRLIGTILSKKLTSSGFDLFHAKNGEEAMEILHSVIPDVIVLDLVLPNMSGFDILESIKKDPHTRNIPVMILSNLSKQSDIERSKSLGALKFMVKASASLDQITEEIRSLSN